MVTLGAADDDGVNLREVLQGGNACFLRVCGRPKVGVHASAAVSDPGVKEDMIWLCREGDIGYLNGLKGEQETCVTIELLDSESHLPLQQIEQLMSWKGPKQQPTHW